MMANDQTRAWIGSASPRPRALPVISHLLRDFRHRPAPLPAPAQQVGARGTPDAARAADSSHRPLKNRLRLPYRSSPGLCVLAQLDRLSLCPNVPGLLPGTRPLTTLFDCIESFIIRSNSRLAMMTTVVLLNLINHDLVNLRHEQ